jgi:hypothetical protein
LNTRYSTCKITTCFKTKMNGIFIEVFEKIKLQNNNVLKN